MRNKDLWIDRLPITISQDIMGVGWGWVYIDDQNVLTSVANGAVAYVPIMAHPGSTITGARLLIKNDETSMGARLYIYRREIVAGAISDELVVPQKNYYNSGETGYISVVNTWDEVEIVEGYDYYIRLVSVQNANPTKIASLGIRFKKRIL